MVGGPSGWSGRVSETLLEVLRRSLPCEELGGARARRRKWHVQRPWGWTVPDHLRNRREMRAEVTAAPPSHSQELGFMSTAGTREVFGLFGCIGLSCDTWDLHCVMQIPLLWCMDSLVVASKISSCSTREGLVVPWHVGS